MRNKGLLSAALLLLLMLAAAGATAAEKGKFHLIYTGQSEGAYGPCG
jgi:hypothetical protein